MTLVAGSWIHPGEACVVQVPVIQFDSLNCIVLELLVIANHDNICSCPEATSAQSIHGMPQQMSLQ